MIVSKIFFWWYAQGWKIFTQQVKANLDSIIDFFSMSDLLRTLFQPFRQISTAGASSTASLEAKFQAFLDRLISRTVGFFTRLTLLLVGTIFIILSSIVSLLTIIIWPLIPLCPIIGIVMSIVGVLA